ncbi:MAG: DUF3857 domain-containing protein [Bacteroidetes bacterium]|nr:DUF3857 domain-containing protein [Bacteroidota bacterium]
MLKHAVCFYRVWIIMVLFSLAPLGFLFSQEKSPIIFGKLTMEDFNLPKSKLIDSNTNAVIIAEMGSVHFVGNKESNWISYVFHKSSRIKIINKKAFELGDVRIMLNGIGKGQDRLDDLQASTFNIENGKIIETKLKHEDIFKDSLNRSHVEEKFNFPDLKEGCILEYSYTVTSFHYWALPYWTFQHREYPCLYSKLETAIPQMLGYLTLVQGQDSFFENKSSKTKELFKMASVDVTAEVKEHTWVMKNLEPFKKEPFLKHPYNYIDKIEFHLLQTYNGDEVSGNTTWANTTKALLESREFGLPITLDGSDAISNVVDKLCKNDDDYMDAAKHIYEYLKNNFNCDPDNDIFLWDDLYTINKKKKGTVADINLLLVAMLRRKNINASPVILSTTEYGTNPSSYPVLNKMNYVICMMKMSGDTIFLDATNPLLGFGKLRLDCYNGHARIISDHDSGSVFFNRDDVRETKSNTVFMVNDENGNGLMGGSVETNPGCFESFNIRNEVKEKGEKLFFENLKQYYPSDLLIENTGIDSLTRLEDPVKIHFDFSFQTDSGQRIIYFNPVLQPIYKENPLKAAERKFPVEMDYPIDDIYNFNMEIPNGYAVDELPKSVKVAYNGNEGLFEYIIQNTGTNVQLHSRIKLNKATFAPQEYSALRDFFAYVVKKQSEQIVFKKKK